MASYEYQIFDPGGNKTALVLGLGDLATDAAQRKAIQDSIFARHKNDADGGVEQVGFINTDKSMPPQLIMTDGEFCANAIRCAAAYYHKTLRRGGDSGEHYVEIKASGAERPIKAGITTIRTAKGALMKVWAYLPPGDSAKTVVPLKDGLYWVTIEGISHLVVPQTQSIPYIRDIYANCDSKEAQSKIALEFLEKRVLGEMLYPGTACGVVFLEHIMDVLKIHPFVYVAPADTIYYESGCGSSAASVGLIHSFLTGASVNFSLLQPSGSLIRVEVDYTMEKFSNVRISGGIEIGKTFTIDV